MVCIDIIYNYPRESIEDVLEDARIMKDPKIDSASFYSLMFSEGSVLSQTVSKDYYNIQTDKELHHAFLGSLLNSGEYEVLEHTKINRKNRDRYQYIRLSHIGTDILPIGLGAGGRLGEYSIYTINKEKKIVSRVNKIQKKKPNL